LLEEANVAGWEWCPDKWGNLGKAALVLSDSRSEAWIFGLTFQSGSGVIA
jgi:hypothetical protein